MARSSSLRRLADHVLEVPGLEAVSQLLAKRLPDLLQLTEVTFMRWNRKLDTFEGQPLGKTQAHVVRLGEGEIPAPEARYLIADGALIEIPDADGEGTLVPLMARSGLVGMLALGARQGNPHPPFSPVETRLLSLLASRTALAVENHLYQRELIDSERMAALGTMAGMLAHDFRGPMTIIRGYAESLAEVVLPTDEVQARAGTIITAVDRLERMTTETLDFARGGARLARRVVDLHHFLEDLLSEVELELPGLTIVRQLLVPATRRIWVDGDKVKRAISNIAANARDAMGGAGRLHVTALLGPPPERGRDHSERLVLTLADEGPGVPDEILSTLFEPFVTRGKKHGTGLGLVVARRFIEDHGGTIDLLPRKAEPPSGARFRITIPAPAETAGGATKTLP
jgi:signal transduction histidine kinase